MAAKRIVCDAAKDDQPKAKRMRTMPSFASVIGEVMMVKSINSLCNALVPMVRRVVNEEVERGLQKSVRTISRSPSFRIQAMEPATQKLVFVNKLLPMIFTCNKVLDINGKPLQLILVEQRGGQITQTVLPHPIKVELVVIDGDFPPSDREVWTTEEFNRRVVKEREGRRPILTKDITCMIRDEGYVNVGEIELTDNSSWIRCRRFRLGARVIEGTSSPGVRILEAVTEPFIVKDHRGQLYKKHYPPMLGDEVWRLEKIGKDGKFHRRLAKENINTVQDLLRLSVIDPNRLKKILGGKAEISEKIWVAILKHARTCNLGNKLYISSGSHHTIILDAICQIYSIKIDGQICSISDMSMALKKAVEQLVKDAYEGWDSLKEVDRSIYETLQLPEGNIVAECSIYQQSLMASEIVIGVEVGDSYDQVVNNDLQIEFGGWEASPQNFM